MLTTDLAAMRNAARKFETDPCIRTADDLLLTLCEHQGEHVRIREMIDDVLDFKLKMAASSRCEHSQGCSP